MKILVVGLGAIGGLIASLAWLKKYEVFCLVKNLSSLEKIGDSISVKSELYGDIKAKPNLILEAKDHFDLIVIAVKSFGLEPSIRNFINGVSEKTIIVTLLNGLGHREILREHFPSNVIVGTIGNVETFLDENRHIIHLNNHPPTIEIASYLPSQLDDLKLVGRFFENIQINVNILSNENEVIWRKLVRLSAIGVVGAALKESLGNILSNGSSRELLVNVVNELTSLANSESVSVDPNAVFDQIKTFNPRLITSLHRDLISGAPSEIDSILIKPLKLGLEKGLNMKNFEYCYKLIQQNFNLTLNKLFL